MSERRQGPGIVRVVLVVAALTAGACQDPLDLANVPDDARMTLEFARSGKTVAPSDTCRVYGVIRFATDDLAGKGWSVDLTISAGALDAKSGPRTARLSTDASSVVTALIHTPADTGWLVVTLRARGATVRDSLHVVAPPPPPAEGESAALAARQLRTQPDGPTHTRARATLSERTR